jgi:chromosome segregation ATPase
VALGRQKAALEEQELSLKEEKARLETAIEQESAQLRQARAAHAQLDKELRDMESLETEENQGYVHMVGSADRMTVMGSKSVSSNCCLFCAG